MDATLLVFTSIYSIASYLEFSLIFRTQPYPYIDEVFHVPQALSYCNGTFDTWDPKITTLPGLYLLTVGMLRPLSNLMGTNACNLFSLRFVNFIISHLNMYLLWGLQRAEAIKGGSLSKAWNAFNIAILPIMHFYSNFYYTDILSTFMVLLMLRLYANNYHKTSAAIGLLSVIVRQTNVIWVGYVFLETMSVSLKLPRDFKLALNSVSPKAFVKKFTKSIKYINIKDLSKSGCLYYLLTCFCFVIFVLVNKGIVVGDRSAHQPVFHILQIFYYSLFAAFFGWPYFVTNVKNFFKAVYKNWQAAIVFYLAITYMVCTNTIAHPYLLSDNRHYTFYLWRRVFDNVVFRYLLVPVYMYAIFTIGTILKHKPILYHSIYWLCLFINLVPQQLLEFRYFILPYIILRLNVTPQRWQLLAESVFYVFIHLTTLLVFMYKEFYWSDSPDVQRLGW